MTIDTTITSELAKKTQMFKPALWLNKIDFINHLTLLNNVMVTILAEEGGGKTTFAQILQSSLDEQIHTFLFKIEAPFNPQKVLASLYEHYHLKSNVDLSVADFASQINERKTHALLIIDDAHFLNESFIQEILLELKKQTHNGYFHVCLLSDYSIVTSLNAIDKEFFRNLIHSIELGGLSEAETKTYVLTYLVAPKRLDKTMTQKRLQQFYRMTGGQINRINLHMQEFFDPAALTYSSPRRSKSQMMPYVTSLCLGLSVAGLSYYLLNSKFERSLPIVQVEAPNKVAEMFSLEKQQAYQASVTAKKVVARRTIPLKSYIPAWHLGANFLTLQPPPLRKIVEFNLDEDSVLDDLVVMDKVLVIPKTVQSTPDMIPEARKVAETAISAAQLVQITTAEKNEDTISKNLFTIQVLASRHEHDLKDFMLKHSNAKDAKIYRTLRQDIEWFVLTVGEFPDRQKAQLALKQLPGDLAQRKPWVRSIPENSRG